ncbi:HAAS signaling domain-containing protein [Paenibacillus macerans]|uniref:HAAS signaling domain-containing protein n=1 Tax=Paenibacillus macerans TaxID=44252 RepID=UPI00203A8C88|nr:DUF1700 domain-containing protein [Paenibacillus macerans]MCM3700910.1 DUF1700 domain-containing protein [Paenibacillus macerans]
MNKNEFIALLRVHLSALPPEEQNELLEDYEAHFEFGLQSGKTEEEIVLELGEPAELAKEALGNRYIPQDHVYWYGSDPAGRGAGAPEPNLAARGGADRPAEAAPAYAGPGLAAVKRRGAFAGVMVYIGLFFLNLIVVPLLLSLWSAFAGFAAIALGGIISPLALGLEFAVHHQFNLGKLFMAVASIGIGILLAVGSRNLFIGLRRLSIGYWNWNVRIAKGGDAA